MDGSVRAWPVVGHVPAFVRDRLGFLRRATREKGPVARLRLGGETWLLNDLEAIQHVLVDNHANYRKTPRMLDDAARRWAGEGLLTSRGERHLERRRTLQPAFHRHAVERYGETVVSTVDEWIGRLRSGEVVDLAEAMMRLTHRLTGRIVLGADYAGADAELGRAVVARRRFIEHVFFSYLPRPEVWPLPVVLRYRRARRVIDREIGARIVARRADPDPPADLLTALLAAENRDGPSLTDEEVADEVVTLLITGWETVGEALSWAWFLLAEHPRTAARAYDEVDRVLGGRKPGISDLPRLVRVASVRDEALRLYPPTWIYVRVALADDVLPGGQRVQRGDKLYLSPWVTHRDARFFPDPDRFDPERFVDVARGRARPHPAFFPFGKGPHVCIGEPLARMEIALVLARAIQRIGVESIPGQAVVPEPRITLTPRDGYRARIRIRGSDGDD